MSNQTPQQWAEELREALTIEGENVPFDRALKRHLEGLTALRSRGLTWSSLANILRRGGVKRPDGEPYSADHIRVSYDRLIKGAQSETRAALSQVGHVRDERQTREAVKTSGLGQTVRVGLRPATTKSDNKDVSEDELALIAARLNKSSK